MKDKKDVELFHTIGLESAKLVKKYRGSLSGEHGDGRLRGKFIPIMLGEHVYKLLIEIKNVFDPKNIFNPEKIVNTPNIDEFLRYEPGAETKNPDTYYNFDDVGGIVRAAEKCNGSGDCRKSAIIGGTMCPSYMASKDEKNTTRGRANILREYMSMPIKDIWDHPEIHDILDLCLSCKGCKSECPSNIDMAKIKSEYMQHWHDKHGIPLRTRIVAYLPSINRIGSVMPLIFNFFIQNKFLSRITKKLLGFAKQRSIPSLSETTFKNWAKRNLDSINPYNPIKTVYLFSDEFTNFNDVSLGIDAIELLTSLGYEVVVPDHAISGRTFLSKGLVRTAKKIANKNVSILSDIVSDDKPLIGIEPSAILAFRDEYIELADNENREKAINLSKNVKLIDEFIALEFEKGNISPEKFHKKSHKIMLHGHCQQKAIADIASIKTMLTIPDNYSIEEIPSGCCGMAGSFGYEKEHYEISQKVGELVLFPSIRNTQNGVSISASGTSCRHQIYDGTGRKALHPVQILRRALLNSSEINM